MKHAVSRELFAYWDSLRGARMAPERGDIDPAAIRSVLADAFVLEIRDQASARDFLVRLAGTRLDALRARPLKGRSFLSLFGTDEGGSVAALLDIVLDDQMPLVAGVTGAPDQADEPIDLEMLLLPLRHHAKTHSRILGSMAARHVPSWLGLRPVVSLELVSFRTISPSTGAPRRPSTGSQAPAYGMVRQGRFTVHQGGLSRSGSMVDRL